MIDDKTRQLVADVGAVVDGLGGGRVGTYPPHLLEALALFDRCRGLFAAVRLLTEQGFGHEALILTRPLFTESLMLTELASVGEKRQVELLVGWALASLDDLAGIMREAESRGDDCSEELAAISRKRSSLEAYARRHDASTRRWRVDEKRLADKHRDGDGYLDYRMAHHFVHGSQFAGEQRRTQHGDTVFVGERVGQQGWAHAAAGSASESVLHAARGICGIVGWEQPAEIDELFERVERLAEVLRHEGS